MEKDHYKMRFSQRLNDTDYRMGSLYEEEKSFLRVYVAARKHHDQKQPLKWKIFLSFPSFYPIFQAHHWRISKQQLKQGKKWCYRKGLLSGIFFLASLACFLIKWNGDIRDITIYSEMSPPTLVILGIILLEYPAITLLGIYPY